MPCSICLSTEYTTRLKLICQWLGSVPIAAAEPASMSASWFLCNADSDAYAAKLRACV
jgi:hypothetical protein